MSPAHEVSLSVERVALATGGRLSSQQIAGVDLEGVCIDSRTVGTGQLFVALSGPRFDGHDFVSTAARRGAAAALVHREVSAPPGFPLVSVADTTRALSDLARDVRLGSSAKVAAVTGSSGKTTTKEMLAALLRTQGEVLKSEGNLNNQYGLPLSLLRLSPEHRFAVLELGMSAPGELRALSDVARPDLAVITMVGRAHLELFASTDAIAEAKAEILEGLASDGSAVLNFDDPRIRRVGERFAESTGKRVLWFGRDRRCDASVESWRGTLQGMRFDLRLGGESLDLALPLAGLHNVTNFTAAALAAHHLGVTPGQIAEAAASLSPARHRGEVLRLAGGIWLLDDCYNANPEAMEAAVASLALASASRRVAFLGDMLELGPEALAIHEATGERLGSSLDLIVSAGPLARGFLTGARRAGLTASALHEFPDSAAAASAAKDLVRPGDAVLVKGSRGSRMEAVVEALVRVLGPESH